MVSSKPRLQLDLEATNRYNRYTYAVNMAALIIESAILLSYWTKWTNATAELVVAIILFLLTIFAINSRGVKVRPFISHLPLSILIFYVQVFGWIELFGGMLKLLLVVAIFVLMMCVNHGGS